MILFLLFLTLVSGALLIKLPLLGLFFMVIITYISVVKKLSLYKVSILFIALLISSSYFYNDRNQFNERTVDHFLIYDYKYYNDSIQYVGKNNKEKFNIYLNDDSHLPIGTLCKGNFTVTVPSKERNFIKRNQQLSMKISNTSGNIYIDNLLSCEQQPLSILMKINELKYTYTKKVLDSSNYNYRGDILMLSIGNKMTLSNEFFSALQKLGIYHLYVISGTHVAYITMILMYVFSKFRIPIEYVKVITIIILILFLLMNVFSPSVFRAVLMAILLITTSFFNKKPYLAVISVTAIIQFIINPYIIFHAGFQLSYVTTFIIILSRDFFKEKSSLLQILIVTVICEICTIVLIIFHFNEISISGIVMNILFSPVFSCIIFPAVLIYNVSLFTYFPKFLDEGLNIIFVLNHKIILFLGQIIEHRLTIQNISAYFIVIFIILSYILIRAILIKRISHIILVTFMFVCTIFLSTLKLSNDIKLVMVDVGQGDAFLIIDEKYDQTVLVDTGGKYYRNDYEIRLSEKTVLPYLKEAGIKTIDLLVITHMDNDHMGEALHINDKLNIKNLYINPQDEKITDEFLNHFNNTNIIFSTEVDELNFKRMQLKNINNIDNVNNSNDQSIVLDISVFNNNILMLGDISLEYEKEILKEVENIDVVKIGHHGSNTSTSMELAKFPFHLALVSSGVNNRYDHPHKEVIERLLENDKKILNTQHTGMVEITFKKEYYCVRTKLQKQENKCYK